MIPTIAHHVDGETYIGTGQRLAEVHNPAIGQQASSVRLASQEDVHAAVASAARAFPAWAALSPIKRVRILQRLLNRLNECPDLAELISAEHGKTISDARGEVQRGIEVLEYAIGAPEFLKGDHSESVARGIDTKSIRFPLGVVAGITPFNFPAMVPMWMWPMALACGNAFVLKPSEKTPSAAMLLAQLATEVGVPDGVFNVVNGDKEAVDALLAHPEVQAISFVGSTPVAKHVYSTGTAAGKRVQALGGAKNHMVVMPDADLDSAVNGLMGAAYGSAGERCMAISVVVAVGKETADELVSRLTPLVRNLKIGPAQEDLDMGPLISAPHRDKVTSYIGIGLDEGAQLVVDGRPTAQTMTEGYFLGGSLFDNVDPAMTIYREEIFGPVLCVVRVDSYAEAVELINAHEFGNGAVIYTRSGQVGHDFYGRVRCGMVGVNIPIPVPVAHHSFGGWKASLFGDHHIHGPEGVRFYTRLKTVTTRWLEDQASGSAFSMPVLS